MKRTRNRRVHILVGLAVVFVAAAVVGFIAYRQLDARRYAAIVARLDSDDPHWRLDDLVASLAATPMADDDNLATPLAELAALKTWRGGDIQNRRAELVFDLVPNLRLTRDQWRAVIDGVEATEAGIPLVLDLERFPRGRHAIVYRADGVSTLLPHIERLHQAAELLDDLRLSAVQRGDAVTALRTFRATLNLGRSLREEPTAISQLTRVRLRKTAVRGLERLLGHVELRDAQLDEAGRELRAELADDIGLLAARGELALIERVSGAIRNGTLAASTLRRPFSTPVSPTDQAADWVRDRVGLDVVGEHAAVLDIGAGAVAAARMPWPTRWAAVQALPGRGDLATPGLLDMLASNLAGLFGNFALDEARVRCALAAVAVERYRVVHGDWPASLAVVGPLPEDPFTGKPLLYKRVADGVVVYSVGPDGTDDGGDLAEASGFPMRSKCDLGVRLWDVPRRNSIPPSP